MRGTSNKLWKRLSSYLQLPAKERDSHATLSLSRTELTRVQVYYFSHISAASATSTWQQQRRQRLAYYLPGSCRADDRVLPMRELPGRERRGKSGSNKLQQNDLLDRQRISSVVVVCVCWCDPIWCYRKLIFASHLVDSQFVVSR